MGPIAQSVEQRTFNPWVDGSSPSGPTYVKTAGYRTLTVYGHTDSVGGIDNQKLSIARANSTIAYLKKLLPGVTSALSGFAASEPVANNATAQGKASNRRAEVFIP